MSAFDDQVTEALNRTFEALRAHVDSDLAACREALSSAAAQEGIRVATEAAQIAAETKLAAERQLSVWQETAARDAEERERDNEARERQAEAREHDAEARERDADVRRQEAEAKQQATERTLDDLRRSFDDMRLQGQRDVDAARQHLERAREDADAARRQIDEHRHELEAQRQQIDADRQAIERFEQKIAEIREALDNAARLPEAIRAMDQAGSFGEALDGLVQFAGREAGRAAVFLMRGDRLNDWRAVGFGDGAHSRLEVAADEPALFAQAARGESGVSRGDALPSFAAGIGPRHAVTLPVMVGGAVVAILYADGPEADKDMEPAWPARLDVLARYAGRMLESITIRQVSGLSRARPLTAARSQVADHPSAGSVQ